MLISKPFIPKIYYLHPQIAGSSSELDAHLDRCVKMGFDHVLIPSQSPDEGLRALAAGCAARQMQLLVDVDSGATGTDVELMQRKPHWYRGAGADEDLPDPRRSIRRRPTCELRYEAEEVRDEIAAHWSEHLVSLAAAGVTGVRCLNLAEPPAAFWKNLIGAVKSAHQGMRFLAWTPGCTPAQIDALAGCGFDASFSSGAWWDYKSRWLAEEQARLARIAPPIAFPDSPDEPVLGRLTGNEEIEVRRRIFMRALRLAAAAGNGMLVPMGFEFGASGLAASVAASTAAGARIPWHEVEANAGFDLSEEIALANAFIGSSAAAFYGRPFRILSGTDAPVAVMLRQAAPGASAAGAAAPGVVAPEAVLIVANAEVTRACSVNENLLLERADGFIRAGRIWPQGDGQVSVAQIELEEADLHMFAARKLAPVLLPPSRGRQAITAAARSPRIAIEAISPSVDGGKFPVKRVIGEPVQVEADVFVDGHDKLAVVLLWRAADEADWREVRMHPLGNDRWAAALPLTRLGRHLFAVEAWRDVFATYRDELEKKTAAGLNVSLELEEGRLLVEAAAAHAQENGIAAASTLKALAKSLKASREKAKAAVKDAERVAALLSEPTAEAMRAADARPFVVRSEPLMRIDVERRAARFSSWYELFPRSQSGDPSRHGTFADVEKRLPAIQAMGFDTLYFTPIHPIGKKHRKGRNNSLTPAPDDPGSPYAIGSEDGGHDALHPELGTIEDFRHLRDAAARHGLELALDFAIQCSPDHPWLQGHPDWFAWRPDGTIRYAENPPKKYQDIVNVDFYAEGAIPGLWIALRDAVLFWVKEGVRVFRVDNPHTKPLPFWEWMIADIRGRYPDTIFLSEAFTRPKMMYRLAKVGYSQSYTYFTWRHTKQEFIDYMTELSTTSVREYFRPHFFVNTPDINPVFLQKSGRPGFLIRAALATTLSGLWGMYSGFELCEATPVPGKEEYLDSEKYEIRAWDWSRPGNIIPEITRLNRIRSENPALQTHRNIRFLEASNDNILFFIKSTAPEGSHAVCGDNTILVAINLDPFAAHEATLELPLWEFDVPDDGALDMEDLVNGGQLSWHGKHHHLQLDPFVNPYAIWRVRHKRA
jgi:starch synthase (maltosyl-transferring)